MLTLFLPNSLATQNLGFILGEFLPSNSVILLSGNLGAGKTTLVQGIGKSLGIKDPIVSPTFTLIDEYLDGRLPLYHLDLYRLAPEEVNTIYPEIYWEGIEVDPGIIAIEWWERLPIKPDNYLTIDLIYQNDAREARLEQHGKFNWDLESMRDLFVKLDK